MSSACFCDATGPAETIYCCEGLVAWSEARYGDAWEAAERSLAKDPGYAPAWLLYAYARYRSGNRREALVVLEGLANDPVVGPRARRALSVNNHRTDRDQVHVSGGAEVGPGAGPLLVVDVPLEGRWGVRIDVRHLTWWTTESRGLAGGLAGTWSTMAGVWRLQLAVGAQGLRDDAVLERMRPGAFAGVRSDVRLVQGFGLGAELGGGALGTSIGPEFYPYGRMFATIHAPARKDW